MGAHWQSSWAGTAVLGGTASFPETHLTHTLGEPMAGEHPSLVLLKGRSLKTIPKKPWIHQGSHFLLRVFCPHQVPSVSKHLQDLHIAALASLNLFSIKHKQKTDTSFSFKFYVGKVIIQFSPVTQSYPTHCNPMDCSTPDFSVHHQLLELNQTHIHRVSEAI